MAVNKRNRSTGWALILAVPLGCFSPTGSPGDPAGTMEPSPSGTTPSTQTADTLLTEASSAGTSTGSTSTPDDSTSTGAACGDGQLDAPEECDDGAAVGGDGCAADCRKEYRRVFVTSMVFTGDLGGLEGADEKCQLAAESVGLHGKFMAWLSAGESSPETRFVHSEVPYIRVDEVEVAADWQDLVDGQLKANIFVSENGGEPGLGSHPCEPVDLRIAWTNTQEKGTLVEAMACGGWTGGSGTALAGNAAVLTSAWTQACILNCSDTAALYCFEQ